MPGKIQQIVVIDSPPDPTEYGLVVRPIGGGGGGPITAPIGPNTQANSVSVTLATDEDPIDVNIVSPSPLEVEIVEPIGPHTKAESVSVTLATDEDPIPVDASGSVVIVAEPVTVDAVDLDIRDLTFAQDKVDASGSAVSVTNFPATQPVSGVVSTKTDLTPSAPTQASVGVASAQAVAANAARKGLILVNVSNAIISLGFGSPAVLNRGATLIPFGSFNMAEYDFDLGAVNAIASAAASPLAIQEYST